MQRICHSLQENGYEVLLRGRILPGSSPLPSFTFRTQRVKHFFRKGKGFYLEYNLRLFFYLLFCRADIFCAVDTDTLAAFTLAARIRHKPLVFDAHEYFTEVPEVVNRPRIQKIWRRVEQWCLPHVIQAYTVSPGLALLFEETYGKKFDVIRNVPVPLSPVPSLQPQEIPVILYQGALNTGRCLEQLIEAVRGLPVQVWIAGEGDLSKTLRQLAEQAPDAQVKFLGYLTPADLKQITPKAWLGFNVLENKGLSYYYSLANKFFDYIQQGIPVMNSPFPEYQALQKAHETMIFAAPRSESIRRSITELLSNPELYVQLQHSCREAAGEWNWDNEEKKLIRLYEEIR